MHRSHVGRLLATLLTLVSAAGCTAIIDSELANKGSGDAGADSGPTGPACTSTEQCLMISDRIFDCMQTCESRVCVSGAPTPDGMPCGGAGSGQLCVAGSCVTRECGDGFVDRQASPPEFCDDGDDNPANQCNNDCTRSCVPPAPPNCDDGNPCNGTETCGAGGTCEVTPPPAPGGACDADGNPGTCTGGVCVAD